MQGPEALKTGKIYILFFSCWTLQERERVGCY
jgi:hypothetical protein